MELLYYLFTALPYLFAVGLGLALPMLVVGLYNNFTVGLVLICLTSFLDAANLSQPYARIGLVLYPADVQMVLVGAAAGLRWLFANDVPRRHAAWTTLALVFFAGLALGLAKNGTGAGVQARPDYYAIAAATYAMSFPIGRREIGRMVIALTLVAFALLLLSCYRWLVYFLPIRDLLPPGGTYNVDGPTRVIGSNFTLLLVEAAVIGLFFGSDRLGALPARLLAPALLAAVIVLQHRSVWLAGIAGVLLCLVVARGKRVPMWQQLALGMAVLAVAAGPLVFSRTLSDQVQHSAARALAGQDTVNARFSNWKATIDQWAGEGPRALAMGRLPGSDTARYVESESGRSQRITFGAHNQYVTVLTSFGLLGLAAFLVVFGSVLLGLWKLCQRRDGDAPISALLLVLIGIQLVYYVAYAVDFMQYLVLGMAISWVALRQRVDESTAGHEAHLAQRSAVHT
jgi:O-antigen ligase